MNPWVSNARPPQGEFRGIEAWLPVSRPLTAEEHREFAEAQQRARFVGTLIFLHGTAEPWAAGWRRWGGPR